MVGRAGSVNVQRWCSALVGAGATVDLLSFERWETSAVRVHRLHGGAVPGRLGYVAAGPQVAAWCRRESPDVLIGYYVTGYGTAAALAGWRPLVQVAAGSDVLAPERSVLKRRIRRRNLARADLVLVMAPHMEEAAVRAGARPEKVVALPHGIALDEFTAVIAHGPPTAVVSTRSLEPNYRHDVVLEAIAACSHLRLTLVGDGSAQRGLRMLTRRLGIEDRVSFLGPVENHDLPRVLAEHSVYVSASSTDGVSASLLEAMAVGLFPVVVDNPANRFWVTPGENGLLFEARSALALGDQLISATSAARNRLAVATKNREVVSARADMRRNAERFVSKLQELVADGS